MDEFKIEDLGQPAAAIPSAATISFQPQIHSLKRKNNMAIRHYIYNISLSCFVYYTS